jgi:hypothetical protein
MLRPILLSAAIALALTACHDEPPSPARQTESSKAAASPTCPATEFDGFFTQFENDVAIQKAYTTVPLESSSIDPNAEPEPKAVIKRLSQSEITFPVIPSKDRQDKDGLKLKRTDVGPTEVTVQLSKPDTDYQMSFHFRSEGCWHLYRVEDESL